MTEWWYWCTEQPDFSTHILTRRMTESATDGTRKERIFNSHPHKEDDITVLYSKYLTWFFNSHPHKEDDRVGQHLDQHIQFFNSHPHKEDD